MADAEERAKKVEEKAAKAAKKEPAAAPNPVGRPAEEEKPKSDSGGLNTTQWLTFGSIAVGLIGIYHKREELKAAFTVGRQNQQTIEQGSATANTPPPQSRACSVQWLPSDGIKSAGNFQLNFGNFLYHHDREQASQIFLNTGMLAGTATGIHYLAKIIFKENLISDPTIRETHFLELTIIIAGNMALNDCLIKENFIPPPRLVRPTPYSPF